MSFPPSRPLNDPHDSPSGSNSSSNPNQASQSYQSDYRLLPSGKHYMRLSSGELIQLTVPPNSSPEDSAPPPGQYQDMMGQGSSQVSAQQAEFPQPPGFVPHDALAQLYCKNVNWNRFEKIGQAASAARQTRLRAQGQTQDDTTTQTSTIPGAFPGTEGLYPTFTLPTRSDSLPFSPQDLYDAATPDERFYLTLDALIFDMTSLPLTGHPDPFEVATESESNPEAFYHYYSILQAHRPEPSRGQSASGQSG